MSSQRDMSDVMNALDFVTWDQLTERRYSSTVTGWISHHTGRPDFIALTFTHREVDDFTISYETSAQAYESKIATVLRRFGGSSQVVSESVAGAFGELVHRTGDVPSRRTGRRRSEPLRSVAA